LIKFAILPIEKY